MTLINSTIIDFFNDNVKKYTKEIGMTFNEVEYTWEEINNISSSFAYKLYMSGVKKGTRVAILGTNSSSWLFYYFAILKLGGIPVLLNSRFKQLELYKSMTTAKVQCLVYSQGFRGMSYDELVSHIGGNCLIKKSFAMEQDVEVLHKLAQEEVEFDFDGQSKSQDIATVLFTSGTTGDAKGVPLSNYNLINNAIAMSKALRMTNKDIICLSVPLFHCFGITACVLASLVAGCKIVVLEEFKTTEVCNAIVDNKCTILNGVPSMFLALLNNPVFGEYDLSSLRTGIIAGSAIYRKDFYEISKAIPSLRLLTSYGQTEASPCITIADYHDSVECRSVYSGKVIPNVQVRIKNTTDGSICDHGYFGEIQVKGYNIMKGYIGAPEIDTETFTEDGWLKTGDIGRLTKDGYLEISGRSKNIIIRGGENISPTEIENYIRDIVDKQAIKVLGIPAEVIQEEIVAVIEQKEDDQLRQEIRNNLKKRISGYKVPKLVIFIEEFPRLASGKINETELKKMVLKLVK
ncbi:MAG: class I adenylate-forming enzyme family protein [Anaerovoracaceae bacterium]